MTHFIHVVCFPSRYLMYYFISKFNKAKMSSFSFRARAVRAVWWKYWSSVASRREPINSCDEQSRHGRQEAAEAKEDPRLELCLCDWSRERPGPKEIPAAREKNRLTLSDSFSSWIGQISPLLAIWLSINGQIPG